MRTAIVGAVLLVLGAVAVGLGILPRGEVADLWDRVWPILLFVVAVTVVTELAAEAGLFAWVAQRTARWGRGRAGVLWLLVVLVAALCTIFLSLDTTAVLLTPVVIVLARHAGLDPLPFALTTVWMANAGSLLLPVSNLTNLLAQHAMGDPSPAAFAARMWAPALVALVVPMVAVFLIARRSLVVRYEPGAEEPVGDRVLVSGLPVWLPASAAAVVLGAVFLVRRRSVLRFGLIPWQLVVLASGLFLFIEALHAVGLGDVLAAVSGTGVSGTGESPLALLRLSLTGMVGANVIDNLPAYLALEPVAGSPVRLAALLIGVNAGPLITPWASLATLLWHQRLTSFDVELRWKRYVLLGVVVEPVTVVPATLALVVTA